MVRNQLTFGISIILQIAPAIVAVGALVSVAGCSSEPDYTGVPVQYSPEDPLAAQKDAEAAKEASAKAAGSGGGE